MEFSDGRNNDEMNKFMAVMKNNTVLDCRIIQLKSYINTLKNELKGIIQQIQEENLTNKRLTTEADIKQSCELQTRNRISNLNETKQMISKLCFDLCEQLNLEKRRYEDNKKFHDNSIKGQLAKWEDYQKMYRTFPMIKEVENAKIQLKKIEIEKMRKQHELKEWQKKLEQRKKIQEQIQKILKEKLSKEKSRSNELLMEKKELINKRIQILNQIETLKQEKTEIHGQIQKKVESLIAKQKKRMGDLYTGGTSKTTQQEFETSSETHSLNTDLPELPQLLLPQITAPSRKIRRVDMVDTSLARHYSDISKLKPTSFSQPINRNNEKRNITSRNNLPMRNDQSLSQTQNNRQGNLTNRFEKQNIRQINVVNSNRVQQLNKERTLERQAISNCNIVNSLINNQNEDHFEIEQNMETTHSNSNQIDDNVSENEEQMDDCPENEENEENSNSDLQVNEELDNSPENQPSCSGNLNEQDKNDDGYYSQNISTQSQSIISQNTLNQRTNSQSQNITSLIQNVDSQNQVMKWQQNNRNKRNEYRGDNLSQTNASAGQITLGHTQQRLHEGNILTTSSSPRPPTSPSYQESNETQSKYFTKRTNEDHTQSRPQTSQNSKIIFKSPPPPNSRSSKPTSTITSQSAPTISSGKLSQLNELQQSSNFLTSQTQQKTGETENEEAHCFSPTGDNMMSSWSKSPSPTRNICLTSPPDDGSCNDSYFNLLSPPDRPAMENSAQSTGESRPINMFGGPQTQDKSSGFNFMSNLSTPSLFSMFK